MPTDGAWAKVSQAAIFDERLSPAAVRILCVLGSYANQHGECWPSMESIGRCLRLQRRIVVKHIKALRDLGYIVVANQPRLYGNGAGGKASNHYFLAYPKATKPVTQPPPPKSDAHSECTSLPSGSLEGALKEPPAEKRCALSRHSDEHSGDRSDAHSECAQTSLPDSAQKESAQRGGDASLRAPSLTPFKGEVVQPDEFTYSEWFREFRLGNDLDAHLADLDRELRTTTQGHRRLAWRSEASKRLAAAARWRQQATETANVSLVELMARYGIEKTTAWMALAEVHSHAPEELAAVIRRMQTGRLDQPGLLATLKCWSKAYGDRATA